MKLSIIIPVYNVEQYIRSCVESVFAQGVNDDEFEVIFVNDGTQDRSFDILEDYVSTHNNVLIINQV